MTESITISKNTLWKVSTIVLALVVIGLLVFRGPTSPNDNSDNNANNADTGKPVDVSDLYDTTLFPALGPEDAEHVVIEFSDFQCPYCALAAGLPDWANQYKTQYADLFAVAGNVQQAAKDGDVRFIYVSMSFLGQESVNAAEAGLCANKQGKFWEMHDAIFTAQTQGENTGKYNKDKLKILAKGISGLDTAKFNSCLDNDETLSDVQEVSSIAQQFASGTPTFYVDGVKTPASWSKISSLIK